MSEVDLNRVRNLLVRLYLEVDNQHVYQYLHADIGDLVDYSKQIRL